MNKNNAKIFRVLFLYESCLTESFDSRNGKMTMKGFVEMHQVESQNGSLDEQETINDLWASLLAFGYGYTLQMERVCLKSLSL